MNAKVTQNWSKMWYAKEAYELYINVFNEARVASRDPVSLISLNTIFEITPRFIALYLQRKEYYNFMLYQYVPITIWKVSFYKFKSFSYAK